MQNPFIPTITTTTIHIVTMGSTISLAEWQKIKKTIMAMIILDKLQII
jgi:hypothetical protein